VIAILLLLGPVEQQSYIRLLEPPPHAIVAEVERLAPQLVGDDARAQRDARSNLLELGPPATDPLLQIMARVGPEEQEAIRGLLPQYGPSAIEWLFWAPKRDLRTADQVRVESRRAVAGMGSAILPSLQAVVDADTSFANEFVLGVLAQMDPVPVPYIRTLLNHRSHNVRAGAVRLLGRYDSSIGTLSDSLSSEDGTVRMFAARALGERLVHGAIDPLLRALTDPDWRVRSAAAAALTKMYQPRVLVHLVRVARADEKVSVRHSVSTSLLQSGDKIAIRLGRRYLPVSIDPIGQMYAELLSAIKLMATGLVMYVLLWCATHLRWSESMPSIRICAAIALIGGAGAMWGYAASGQSAVSEQLLIVAVVPSVVWVGWWTSQFKIVRVAVVGGITVLLLVLISSLSGYSGIILRMQMLAVAPWLLAAVCVATLGVAYAQRAGEDSAVQRKMRRAAVAAAGAFYVGYAIGWVALCGDKWLSLTAGML